MRSAVLLLAALWLALPAGRGQQSQPLTFDQIRTMLRETESRIRDAGARGNVLTQLDELRALEAEFAPKGPAATQAIATWFLTLAPRRPLRRSAPLCRSDRGRSAR